MKRIVRLLYTYSYSILFITLLALGGILLFRYNKYQRSFYFNSSSYLVAYFLDKTFSLRSYLNLEEKNAELERQNQYLLQALPLNFAPPSTNFNLKDSVHNQQISYKSAQVIRNSIKKVDNIITIDKGKYDGIKKGMGVVTPFGVIGIVLSTSNRYSIVQSLLSKKVRVSASLSGRENTSFGTLNWDAKSPLEIDLLEVPRNFQVVKGDTVKSSSFSFTFPSGIPIGTVKRVSVEEENNFYDIKVELLQNFYNLNKVFVVKYLYKHELDSLNQSL